MQVGFKCPRGNVSYETCRVCRQDPLHPCGIPGPLLEQLERQSSGDEELETEFTPSRLLGCYRVPVLTKEDNYYLNVAHAYSSLRGQLIHSGLEQLPWHAGYQTVREKRLRLHVDTQQGPQLFQAKPDMIVIHASGEEVDVPEVLDVDIWDWKTREFKTDMTAPDLNHIRQIWMYAYIVSKTPEQWWGNSHDMPEVRIRSVNICYISSSGTRIFSSLGPGIAYVQRGRGKDRHTEELALDAIPTYSLKRVERFVRERIEAKLESAETMPAALDGDDAKWCFRCPVLHACKVAGPGVIPVSEVRKRLRPPNDEPLAA